MPGYTLRVSVIEHCQLRCGYCLPEAPAFLSKKNWLSLEDYAKIARLLARFLIKKVRFTGGEPLLRVELPRIVEIFARALPEARLAITTNGQRFSSMAGALVEAGLHTITLHVDSLKKERYELLMGKGTLKTALKALELAQQLGLTPKINVVVQRGLNDDELVDFLRFSKFAGAQVRFIELMDTGSARDFVAAHFMSGREIVASLKTLGIYAVHRAEPSDPAQLFFAEEFDLTFGIIASDTEPFCHDCDRLRLSADGQLYTCLYEAQGQRLSLELEDEGLFKEMEHKIARKESWHPSQKKSRRLFSMSQTGG